MQVRVYYQGIDPSPWLDEFIDSRIARLERYLGPTAIIQVHLEFEITEYYTTLAIHNSHHEYAFRANGDNLYESFSTAIEKAASSLGDEKRKLRDKIRRKFFSGRGDFIIIIDDTN